MNTQHNNQRPLALGGFFSWLKRTVNNVLNAISEVSHNPLFMLDIFEDIFDGNGFTLGNDNGAQGTQDFFQMFRLNIYPEVILTPFDESKLDTWVNSKFLPLFKPYFLTIKNFSLNPPSLDVFYVFYNEVYQFISLIKWYEDYVLNIGENGFSSQALIARNQFLDIQLQLLIADINKYVTTTNINLNPVETTVMINASKYATLGFNTPTKISLNTLQIKNPDASNNIIVVNTPESNGAKTKTNGTGLFFLALIGLGFILSKNAKENEIESE